MPEKTAGTREPARVPWDYSTMYDHASREQKSPARNANELRASADHLSSTKARAVRALVSIHRLHLIEFQL